HVKQRGLAGAVRADDREDLVPPDRHADPGQCLDAAKGETDRIGFQDGFPDALFGYRGHPATASWRRGGAAAGCVSAAGAVATSRVAQSAGISPRRPPPPGALGALAADAAAPQKA